MAVSNNDNHLECIIKWMNENEKIWPVHDIGRMRDEVQKTLQLSLMYGISAGALNSVVPKIPETRTPRRHKLIVEIEVDAVDQRAAERSVIGMSFMPRVSSPYDLFRPYVSVNGEGRAIVKSVLMCEPIVDDGADKPK